MGSSILVRVAFFLVLVAGIWTQAAAEEPAPPAPAPVDVVTLKDGSVIYGEVLEKARSSTAPQRRDPMECSSFTQSRSKAPWTSR
jgi:hypothetical protein